MCGLIAINGRNVKAHNIDNALDSIRHRGPDGSGTFCSERDDCILGHRRLSILDLSNAGCQPITDGTGRYVMIFNGEIYNFIELRGYLDNKYGRIRWRSSGDSEVIVEGYADEGHSFIERLNGMFSIIIYDKYDKTLLVTRDPVGIKPLFMARLRENIVFASELKAFRHIENLDVTIRHLSVADMMQFGFVPEPWTLYEEVTKVPAGALWTFRRGEMIDSIKMEIIPEKNLREMSENDLVDQFRHLFAKAVKRQCRSDVPIGIMLSGGIDSSAVALECAEQGIQLERAFTLAIPKSVATGDIQSDDLHYAKFMAESIGLDLEVLVADETMLEQLGEIGQFLDDGIGDPAAVASYLIYKRSAEQGIKVQLTGQGGDEYLYGYRRYQAVSALSKIPAPVQGVLGIASSLLPNTFFGHFNAPLRRLRRFSGLLSANKRDRIVDLYSTGNLKQKFGLFSESIELSPAYNLLEFYDSITVEDELERLHHLDIAYDLRSLNLVYSDRMSMACGVEARIPFLDFDLLKFLKGLPSNLKLRGGNTKYILKKALEGRLSPEIVNRSKAGFALPIRSWLASNSKFVKELLDEQAFRELGIFDMDGFRSLVSSVRAGNEEHASQLFALICFRKWFEATKS